jgi:alanyl-tRNA synthetase
MTGNAVRQKFLDYFAARGHRVVKSSSLVPANDPTLLFTNAGMNQFKDVFLGLEKRDYSRAATSQKCVRAGGKHNDLDNVGYTRRHHTFFEMLGNFSFGDYFKSDAIAFAWELITKDFGIPKDKLYVTVFREDDDAENLWQSVAGVPKDRIFRLDEKDNFWQMGDTGPCGPCSEIYYDFGPGAADPGKEHVQFPEDAGDRYVEIWNLVFMQFDRASSGAMTPLPRPSIDTGMGLERTAAVLQGKISNYETDLLRPIIDRAGELFNIAYGDNDRTDVALRINADHARATAFLIHDGVLPSNEGRGYVLRKIMRRAIRNARMIGRQDPYLYELAGFVAELMKPGYPELMENIQRVARVVKDEEHRYATTFQVAEKIFNDEAKAATSGIIPGAAAFKLYDTYGLALDEQEDMARELHLTIDRDGFTAEMDKQRSLSRASWRGADKAQVAPVYKNLPATEFIGRETLEAPVEVVRVIEQDGRTELVFDRSPFYAEAGGQVGDTGSLYLPSGEKLAAVEYTYKPAPGSVVEPSRLRFDFTHYTALDPEEIAEVERLANQEILKNIEVHTDVMDLDDALSTGAMALFGEKYGEKVRVVSVEGFSKELCGGTHVSRTGDIGVCKISYEGSIAAGVRRIEAITGEGALHRFQDAFNSLHRAAYVINSTEDEVVSQIEKLLDERKALEKQIEQMKDTIARAQIGGLENDARVIKGIRVLAAQVPGMDRTQLRTLADSLRTRQVGVVVLAASDNGNISIVSAVTKDLTAKVHAGKLASSVAQAVGGKGGGRPDMAEAGGKNPEALPGALAAVYSTVEGML